MHLAHASGAITFTICVFLHVNEVEPGPNYPMNTLKLACSKQNGMESFSIFCMSAFTAD